MGTTTSNPTKRRKTTRKGKGVHTSRRTTITLSPESREIVEKFRSANGASTSAAIDQIILHSEPRPSRLKNVNGFLVLDLPGDSSKVCANVEDIKRAEDEMDREYVERFMRFGGKNKKSRRK
jgi:hypothetical protein